MVDTDSPDSVSAVTLAEIRVKAVSLAADDVPSLPGVYVWFDGAEVFFIGTAGDLRQRILRHLTQAEGARSSALRRVVAEHLGFGQSANLRTGRSVLSESERFSVHQWLINRDVAWVACNTSAEAARHETSLKAALAPGGARTSQRGEA